MSPHAPVTSIKMMPCLQSSLVTLAINNLLMMQANGSSSSEMRKAADYILLHTGLDKTARFQGAVAEAVAKTFDVSSLGNHLL